jgi:hypothetical protein
MWRSWLVLLLASGVAHGDRLPIGISATVGIGLGAASTDPINDADTNLAYSAKVDLGYRFADRAMVLLHGGFASRVTEREYSPDPMFDTIYEYAAVPLQVGVGGLYMLSDRLYVSGWAGIERVWRTEVCETFIYTNHGNGNHPDEMYCSDQPWKRFGGNAPAFGAAVGFDAIAGSHRLTIAASISHAFSDGDNQYEQYSYSSLALDVGYRFWAN